MKIDEGMVEVLLRLAIERQELELSKKNEMLAAYAATIKALNKRLSGTAEDGTTLSL
jgi:hypothetical protein